MSSTRATFGSSPSGPERNWSHKPNLEERGGKRLCYYSFVKLKDGSEDFIVMNLKEVQAIRARSKSPDAGPWVTDFDEMGKGPSFDGTASGFRSRPRRDSTSTAAIPTPWKTTGGDASNTWSEMLGEGQQETQRLTARERVLNQPSFVEPAEWAETQE